MAFITIGQLGMAQQVQHPIRCYSDEVYQQQIANNPALKASYEAADALTTQVANTIQQQKTKNGGSAPLYIIPVVVHVVWKTAVQNIPDTAIYTQIQRLNEDYRRINPDSGNTISTFKSIVGDSRIEFRLAVRDPNGNCTNGIVRKQTTTTSFSTNDNVKKTANGGDDPWPTGSYLNLWSANLSGGVLGYAQFPGGAAATDGVVILYSAFGQKGVASAPYDLGRTATHEVGHWLNLYHTFQGGCTGTTSTTCGTQGDKCCDTPPVSASNFGCPAPSTNSCNETYLPRVDMTQNYMDYTDDACMNAFTFDQIARMQACMSTTRNSLNSSLGLTPVTGTPNLQVANDTICAGSSTTITASGGTSYYWTPYSHLNSMSTATVIASPTVTTVYTVYATMNNCTFSRQDTITVVGTPTNISVSPTAVCSGMATLLTATGSSNYSWSPANGLNNTTHDTVRCTITSPTTYTITTHDTIGSTVCTATKLVPISISPAPNVNFSPKQVCTGNPTNITATGASTYTWSPATGLSGTTGAVVTATLTATTTYTVTGTSSTGCVGTRTDSIKVNPLPVISVTPTHICPGVPTLLTASGANTYSWNPGTGLSTTSGANVTCTLNNTTTYNIQGTNTITGCVKVQSQTITVYPAPNSSFSVGSNNNLSVTFNAAVTSGYSYSWNFGDASAPGTQPSPTHNYAMPDTFTVCLTVTETSTGCTDSACQTIIVTETNGVKEIQNSVFSIVPNPTNDDCTIKFSLNNSSTVKLTVNDILGREMMSENGNKFKTGTNAFILNTSRLSKGVYFVTIDINGLKQTKKLIKQ